MHNHLTVESGVKYNDFFRYEAELRGRNLAGREMPRQSMPCLGRVREAGTDLCGGGLYGRKKRKEG